MEESASEWKQVKVGVIGDLVVDNRKFKLRNRYIYKFVYLCKYRFLSIYVTIVIDF